MARPGRSRLDSGARLASLALAFFAGLTIDDHLAGLGITGAVCIVALGVWHRRARPGVLRHLGAGRWVWDDGRRCHTGVLVAPPYRSTWLIVLAIRTADRRIHRIPLWSDTLSRRDFSFLRIVTAATFDETQLQKRARMTRPSRAQRRKNLAYRSARLPPLR